MSDAKDKPKEAPAGGGGGAGKILGLLLPAVIAGAAAFGGAKVAGAHAAAPPPPERAAAAPPGPTLALEPFLFTVPDANKKAHPMRVTIALEFEGKEKGGGGEGEGDPMKGLVPRIRDSALGYLRTLTYDEATDPAASDKMRTEILERVKASGADKAQRILITDLVVQ